MEERKRGHPAHVAGRGLSTPLWDRTLWRPATLGPGGPDLSCPHHPLHPFYHLLVPSLGVWAGRLPTLSLPQRSG